MSNILYKKVGRKYVPIQEYVDMTGWPAGHYLVTVQPGVTSATRMRLNPDYPAALAAMRDVKEEMIKWLSDASRAKPVRKISPEAMEAWEAFVALCDDDIYMIGHDSCHDIIANALEYLEEMVNK